MLAYIATPPLKVGARPRCDTMETEKGYCHFYQGSYNEIDLTAFGWEIIEL